MDKEIWEISSLLIVLSLPFWCFLMIRYLEHGKSINVGLWPFDKCMKTASLSKIDGNVFLHTLKAEFLLKENGSSSYWINRKTGLKVHEDVEKDIKIIKEALDEKDQIRNIILNHKVV